MRTNVASMSHPYIFCLIYNKFLRLNDKEFESVSGFYWSAESDFHCLPGARNVTNTMVYTAKCLCRVYPKQRELNMN